VGKDGQVRIVRYCRANHGNEITKGKCDTPGMKLRHHTAMIHDPRGFWRIEIPRTHRRLIPTSKYMLCGHRANCDFAPILYVNPMHPAIKEYRKTVGYIVDYACKSTDNEKMTVNKMRTLIKEEKDNNTGTDDLKRVAIKCMNQMGKNKLMSKQEAVTQLGKLALFECSETIDVVSINQGKSIDENGYISKTNQISLYGKRNAMFHHLSFYQWQIEKRKRSTKCLKDFIPHIVGPFTRPTFPFTEEYAKAALMIHKPWSGNSMISTTKIQNL
jgi:hypothetical protein